LHQIRNFATSCYGEEKTEPFFLYYNIISPHMPNLYVTDILQHQRIPANNRKNKPPKQHRRGASTNAVRLGQKNTKTKRLQLQTLGLIRIIMPIALS